MSRFGSEAEGAGGAGGMPGYDDPSGSGGAPPSEEELRAYEEEIKKVRVEHVLLEHVVALVNLGMRRTGLAPGTEAERDPAQVRLAIESIRALMPVLEQSAPQHAAQIKSALSQLQLAFVRIGGQAPAGSPGAGAGSAPGEPPEPSRSPDPARDPLRDPGRDPGPAGSPSSARPEQPPPKPGEAGPAQRSGRLWVPGQ